MTTLDSVRNVTVNQNGEATIRYTPTQAMAGNHKLIAKYNTSNHYNSASKEVNFNVLYPSKITRIQKYYNITTGENKTIMGRLINAVTSQPIASETVYLMRGATELDSCISDSQGYFSLRYTPQVDTITQEVQEEDVLIIFEGSNTYDATIKEAHMRIEHTYGLNTENAWSTTMFRGGGLDAGMINTNYTNHPMFLYSIPFESDFKLVLNMHVDYLGAYGHFGLSKSNSQITPELKINQTKINDTQTISDVFTVRNQRELLTIERTDDVYVFTHNGEEVKQLVMNPSTVYFYVEKTGNGSLILDTMTYIKI